MNIKFKPGFEWGGRKYKSGDFLDKNPEHQAALRKLRKENRAWVGLPETATEEETDAAFRSKFAKYLEISETSSWQEISDEFTRQLKQRKQG